MALILLAGIFVNFTFVIYCLVIMVKEVVQSTCCKKKKKQPEPDYLAEEVKRLLAGALKAIQMNMGTIVQQAADLPAEIGQMPSKFYSTGRKVKVWNNQLVQHVASRFYSGKIPSGSLPHLRRSRVGHASRYELRPTDSKQLLKHAEAPDLLQQTTDHFKSQQSNRDL